MSWSHLDEVVVEARLDAVDRLIVVVTLLDEADNVKALGGAWSMVSIVGSECCVACSCSKPRAVPGRGGIVSIVGSIVGSKVGSIVGSLGVRKSRAVPR